MASAAVPMTPLGGRAFNHDASAGVEAEFERLRGAARAEGDQMRNCFEQADQARGRGARDEARRQSDAGKAHQARMRDLNRQASELIFRENNAPGRVAADTIDLHGQFVDEAEGIVEKRVRQARAEGQTHLHVIVGRGNHSPGHVQHIKPCVERVCRGLGLAYQTEQNEGRIYVDLTGGKIGDGPPQPDGHTGSPYPGAGNGYQTPQSPPQQQQQPDPIELLLSSLCKRMADCCIVM